MRNGEDKDMIRRRGREEMRKRGAVDVKDPAESFQREEMIRSLEVAKRVRKQMGLGDC